MKQLAVICAAYASWDLWDSVYKQFYLNLPNFVSVYGKDSYALITGGSEGIGKGFADALASKGVNVILVARNKDKLEKAKQDIEKRFKVKVITHSMDLSKSSEHDYRALKSKTDAVDVSLLVNNAGMISGSKLRDYSHDEVEKIISLNCTSAVHLMKLYLPNLENRGFRSGVINVGSSFGVSPMPYCSLYSATKVFGSFMAIGTSEEYRESVDFLSYQPSTVSTPGTKFDQSWRAETVDDAVLAALKDLGRKRYTYGTIKHTFIALVLKVVPDSVLLHVLYRKLEKVYKDRQGSQGNR